MGDIAQIVDAVVIADPIDMVNLVLRLFAVMQEPRNTAGAVVAAVDADDAMALAVDVASAGAEAGARAMPGLPE